MRWFVYNAGFHAIGHRPGVFTLMVKNHSTTTVVISAITFSAGVLAAVLWMTISGAGGAATMGGPGGIPGETSGGNSGAPGAGHKPMGMPPATVRVGEARAEKLRQRTAVIGRLREVRRATVAAEVEGKVLAVPVQEGDPVIGGQTVLARIDGVWAKLDLARTQAQVAAAQATLDQSELDLSYLEQLLKAQSAKPKEVDDMRATVSADSARLSATIAERDRVEKEVERLVVLAPFDGSVTRKITEVGQWVAPGDEIVEVISHGRIDAVADVPEHVIDLIHVGDTAEVVIEPLGLPVRGELVAINPSGGNSARTFPVKVRLDDMDGRLKAGMSVTVWLPIGPAADYLTVPRDAVSYGVDGQSVWVGVPGEPEGTGGSGPPVPTAEQVAVRVLFGEGGRVAVEPLSGRGQTPLTDGAVVVVEGSEGLTPGRTLIYTDDPPPAE
jgi:membrane fusion protein, multidrug efflux system